MNSPQLTTRLDRNDPEFQANLAALDELVEHLRTETATARLGGPIASR